MDAVTARARPAMPDKDAPAREAQRLSSLLDVSQALSGTLNLKASLHHVLEILARHHGAVRGIVSLADAGGELRVEASDGLPETSRGVSYRLGEGITGRVVQSGKPVVVPRVSREPAFLHRAARRPELPHQELSFICVPIFLNRRPIGALAIDLKFKPDRNFERSTKFLGVVASMIAQAIKIHRLIDEDKRRLVDENAHLRQELRERYDFSNLVGSSGPMRQIFEQGAQVAGTNTTVLVRGESGTGKELIAHAIHYSSLRAKKPFVKVSCAALPESLIESELFGYEKGAFTGAEARKKGRFELADGGTLFLDEIGEMDVAIQARMLKALEEKRFRRVGGVRDLQTDFRLVAATNRDLQADVSSGRFRNDLYYRLNVVKIRMPPLRERMEDLPIIVDVLLRPLAKEMGRPVPQVSAGAMRKLESYGWPGNVRELRNVLERALLTLSGLEIRSEDLALENGQSVATTAGGLPEHEWDIRPLDAVVTDYVRASVTAAGGNVRKAARQLEISPSTLYARLKTGT